MSEIIVSPNESNLVNLAAFYFQSYIQNITGVTLGIHNETSGKFNFTVYIGRSNFTDSKNISTSDCKYGGFKILTGESYLVLIGDDSIHTIPSTSPSTLEEWEAIVGPDRWINGYLGYDADWHYNSLYDLWEMDERGTMNAVNDFVYGQGVRIYSPSPIGRVIPKRDFVQFHDICQTKNPEFMIRYPYVIYHTFGRLDNLPEEENDRYTRWVMGLRLNDFAEFMARPYVHGIGSVTNLQYEAHPEFFANVSGIHQSPEKVTGSPTANLCFPYDTDENILFREHLEYIHTIFDVYDPEYIHVGPHDGFTRADDGCKHLEQPEKGYYGTSSNYVWEYVNNLAWAVYENPAYSHKKIFNSAYSSYLMVPDNLTRSLAPNLAVKLAKTRSGMGDPETKAFYEEQIELWLEALPSKIIFTYDYYIHNVPGKAVSSVPFYFPHVISQDLGFMGGVKVHGELMEVSANWRSWDINWDTLTVAGFNLYLTSRFYWNSTLDVDELLDEYYSLYFGPSGGKMKEFIEYSENNYDRVMEDSSVFREMVVKIKEARAVAGNTIYGERIDEIVALMNSTGSFQEIPLDSCQTLIAMAGSYKLTQSISSQETCITFANVGITLDCAGHTITYGLAGGNHYGFIAGHRPYANDWVLKNCVIESDPGNSGATFQIHYSNNVQIIDTNVTSNGVAIWLIRVTNFLVENVRVNSVGRSFSYQGIKEGTFFADGAMVRNNVFHSTNDDCVYMYRCSEISVIGNSIWSDTSHGVRVFNGGNHTIAKNIIHPDISYYQIDSPSEEYDNTFV